MSTNATIAVKNDDGSFTGIYLHWDGYPSHTGRVLLNHYGDEARLRELLGLGDISTIAERLAPDAKEPHGVNRQTGEEHRQSGVVVAYGRDFGDTDTGARTYRSPGALKRAANRMAARYLYVFDGQWFVAQRCLGKMGPLVPMNADTCNLDQVYATAPSRSGAQRAPKKQRSLFAASN